MPQESLELSLSSHAYGGEALGRDAEGRMVFVPFALPGECVRVEIRQAHQRWARARLLEVLEPSAERITPRCRHFTLCGGCHYQHLNYAHQLQAKRHIVREQMARIGGFQDPPVDEFVPSPGPWNYRNHMRFGLTQQGRLGLVAAEGDDVFELQECHLPEQALCDLWPRLDLDALPGVNQVGVRSGSHEEVLVVLHGEGSPDVEIDLDLPISLAWLGPGGMAVLAGEGHVLHEVLGQAFQVSAGSFFQVNSLICPEMVRLVLQTLDPRPGEVVFDLYAGVGLFSAFLAQRGARVVAVEESAWACADFQVNLDAFDGVSLYQSTVELALPAIADRPQAILVDPPRSGLSRQALDQLCELSPSRLAYLSCDLATLARDARRLAQAGYKLQRITPLDLFPQTFHVETLSAWLR